MSDAFTLSDQFIDRYANKEVPWGFKDAAGVSLGEITYLRTYSRLKPDGTKERWHETCRRVIEGMFTIQKRYCAQNRIPWDGRKAHATARDAYDRLFNLKWTPPGRGLWMMGTPMVMEQHNSAALQNCAFVSTADMSKQDPAAPFAFLMEASMLGVGVGFDTLGADTMTIISPSEDIEVYEIPDTREGWVEATRRQINASLVPGHPWPKFDYGRIRPAGEPIRTFGGTAAGPAPLMELHEAIRKLMVPGDSFSSTHIVDIANLIGRCVVSGNVRRSAELALGSIDDTAFLSLKDASVNPERMGRTDGERGWGWLSNNSVNVPVGTDLAPVLSGIQLNGEPGVVWMDVARRYGRLVDAPNDKDYRAAGVNPCSEQVLESYECCTLIESFLNRHDSLEDYLATLKVAYLYGKTVTLLPTHWERTNAVMLRNRRIGTSMSGVANFLDAHGMSKLVTYMERGYQHIQHLDKIYSDWLGVRESIKTTTVKPSGTVSLLAGESPGVHWSPGSRTYWRTMRFRTTDTLVSILERAGYRIEPDITDPEGTVVVYFPIKSEARRSERDVSAFEKIQLAAVAQRYWSDNSVSVTVSFTPEEASALGDLLRLYDGQLKSVSFLPLGEQDAYPQMPYQPMDAEVWEAQSQSLLPPDLSPLYDGDADDAIGESGCTTDVCEIKSVMPTNRK